MLMLVDSLRLDLGKTDFRGWVEGVGVGVAMLFSVVPDRLVAEDVVPVGMELTTSGFERFLLFRCCNFACLAALCFPLLGISYSW